MNGKKWSLRVLAFVMTLMLGSTPVNAYWVDRIQSDWTVSLTREVTIKVIGFSTEPQNELAPEELALAELPQEENIDSDDEMQEIDDTQIPGEILPDLDIDPPELSLPDDRAPSPPDEDDAENNDPHEVQTGPSVPDELPQEEEYVIPIDLVPLLPGEDDTENDPPEVQTDPFTPGEEAGGA